MLTIQQNRFFIKVFFGLILMYCGMMTVQNVAAAEKWQVLGNTIWVSGDSRLTLDMPQVAHPYLQVSSGTAADLQWIETTIPFALGATIKAVYLCYQAPDEGTYISQIRLAEYLLPSPAVVKHDDGTDLSSASGDCYLSNVGSYKPNGSVNLSLRLNFANPGDMIRVGALGILIDE